MKKSILYISAMFLMFIACREPANPVVKALHEEIMKHHDEVMLKTSDIHKRVKELKKRKKLVPEPNKDIHGMIDRAINGLEAADENMMKWMQYYKKPKFSDDSPETINRMNEAKDKMVYVDDQIDTALKNAAALEERIKIYN